MWKIKESNFDIGAFWNMSYCLTEDQPDRVCIHGALFFTSVWASILKRPLFAFQNTTRQGKVPYKHMSEEVHYQWWLLNQYG